MLSKSGNENGMRKIAFTLILLGAIDSSIGSVSGGIACFSAGFLILIISQYDIAHFKFGILEARLKAKLNEAEEILMKLKGISLPISEIAVISASQTGRYELEVPRKKLYDYIFSISSELKNMGVEPDKIEKVKEPWYLTTAIDMALPIHNLVRSEIDFHIKLYREKDQRIHSGELVVTEAERNDFYKLFSNINDNQSDYYEGASKLNSDYISYPDYFRGVVMGLNGIPEIKRKEMLESINEIILDIEYLITNKDIRRPDVWFKNK